ATASSGSGPGPLDAGRRFLFLLALAALVGALAVVGIVRRSQPADPLAPAARYAETTLLAAALVGAVGAVVTSIVDVVGRSADGGGYGGLRLGAWWGRLWLAGLGAAVITAAAVGLLRRYGGSGPGARLRWGLAVAGTVAVAAVEAAHGHAGAFTSGRVVA